MSLLGQVLATLSTQTLHHYWMAALFDSDNHTPKKMKGKHQCLKINMLIAKLEMFF